jgi:hypothetical protein
LIYSLINLFIGWFIDGIESNSSDGKPNLNDVNWINIEFCKDIQIKSEAKREDVLNTQLPQINTQKVWFYLNSYYNYSSTH